MTSYEPELLFGVMVDDIAELDAEEFDTLWEALGKIARQRGRAARKTGLDR